MLGLFARRLRPSPGDYARRQTTQPSVRSEATIRQPAGRCGQLAVAGPAVQSVSTTVTPAGGWLGGTKSSGCVQEISNDWGTQTAQLTLDAMAIWSPGFSRAAATMPVVLAV